jgi:hypothetical protein
MAFLKQVMPALRQAVPVMQRSMSSAAGTSDQKRKVAILGAGGGIGQPLGRFFLSGLFSQDIQLSIATALQIGMVPARNAQLGSGKGYLCSCPSHNLSDQLQSNLCRTANEVESCCRQIGAVRRCWHSWGGCRHQPHQHHSGGTVVARLHHRCMLPFHSPLFGQLRFQKYGSLRLVT